MASHRHTRPELSVIPDLRFEYSYLKSISRYVRLERLGNDDSSSSRLLGNHPSEKFLEDYENLEPQDQTTSAEEQSSLQPSSRLKEVVLVQWDNVLWLTIRDQVIAPFLQGALWGVASYYLTPAVHDLGSKFRHIIPKTEGKFSEGLRNWVKSFIGVSAKSTEERPR